MERRQRAEQRWNIDVAERAPVPARPIEQLRTTVTASLPVILTEVREQLCQRHPQYADYLIDEFDTVVMTATALLDRLLGPNPPPTGRIWPCGPGERELFEQLGRSHFRDRRDVKDLLAAYRCGATVAWRHISHAAIEANLETEAFAGVADGVFTAVDELSAASLRGYMHEQSADALAIEHRRHELTELLLCGSGNLPTIQLAATRAAWTLPEQATVVLVQSSHDHAARLRGFDPACLILHAADELVAIVPDPTGPGRRAELSRALSGSKAVVGLPVCPLELPASKRMATQAAQLRRAGILQDDPLFVGEHLDSLIVHQDGPLLAALRAHYLHPLDGLPYHTRTRLTATLAAWLRYMGNHKQMAARLHIHAQTVRYRLAQLHELFGCALDDPDTRAALTLALAWGEPASDPTQTPTDDPALPRQRSSAHHAGQR